MLTLSITEDHSMSEIHTHQDGAWTVIHAPGHWPLFGSFVIGALFGVIAWAATLGASPGAAALVGLGVWIVVAASTKITRKIQRRPFAVAPEGLRLPSGRVVPRSQIYGVEVLVGVTRNIHSARCLLVLNAAGRRHVLAGGLTEAMATAAQTETLRVWRR